MKVFADKKQYVHIDGYNEDNSFLSDLTSQEGTTTNTFCLRFGAIAITPGTSVRRHAINSNNEFNLMRLNCSMDACHLHNERGCLTDIIQPMASGEMLLDTFTLDSQNEGRDVWHLALTCDKNHYIDIQNIPCVVTD